MIFLLHSFQQFILMLNLKLFLIVFFFEYSCKSIKISFIHKFIIVYFYFLLLDRKWSLLTGFNPFYTDFKSSFSFNWLIIQFFCTLIHLCFFSIWFCWFLLVEKTVLVNYKIYNPVSKSEKAPTIAIKGHTK